MIKMKLVATGVATSPIPLLALSPQGLRTHVHKVYRWSRENLQECMLVL